MNDHGEIQLTDSLLAKLAGWDAVKQARSLVAGDRVLASDWQPPKLQGTVRDGHPQRVGRRQPLSLP